MSTESSRLYKWPLRFMERHYVLTESIANEMQSRLMRMQYCFNDRKLGKHAKHSVCFDSLRMKRFVADNGETKWDVEISFRRMRFFEKGPGRRGMMYFQIYRTADFRPLLRKLAPYRVPTIDVD